MPAPCFRTGFVFFKVSDDPFASFQLVSQFLKEIDKEVNPGLPHFPGRLCPGFLIPQFMQPGNPLFGVLQLLLIRFFQERVPVQRFMKTIGIKMVDAVGVAD